jgi:ABC-2 type transport system ATP-binding protein
MRADLAAALLHDPALLFLDEPTIGLDVVAKERIRQFIKTINRERGTTVILTTHDLGDVEKLCERVIMIDRGKIMFDGALEALRRRFGQGRVLVVDFEQLPARIDLQGAEWIRAEGNRAWLRVAGNGNALAPVVAELFHRHRVLDLSVQEPEIEEVVRRIYEGHLLEA